MHTGLPLEADDSALRGLQQRQGREQGYRQPNQQLKPSRRRISNFDGEKSRHHNVADDNDDKIGGKVVGALRRVILSANFAVIDDLQKTAEQMPAAAVRALHGEAAPQGFGE